MTFVSGVDVPIAPVLVGWGPFPSMLDVVGSYKLRVASYGLSICHQILRYGLDLFELASLVLSRGDSFLLAASRRFHGGYSGSAVDKLRTG